MITLFLITSGAFANKLVQAMYFILREGVFLIKIMPNKNLDAVANQQRGCVITRLDWCPLLPAFLMTLLCRPRHGLRSVHNHEIFSYTLDIARA
jgi:hypothetical protein